MNEDKPRIAFCFSWQARTLDQTYLFFQKNLFNTAKEQWFEYDIFCAVEDDEDVDKVNLLNPTKVKKIKSSEVEKNIEKKWWKDWRNNLFWNYIFLGRYPDNDYYWGLLQQFYKTSESINLVKSSQKEYDIIIRLRFDVILFNKINFTLINKTINENNWLIICNTAKQFIKTKFISDRFLIINDFFFFWWKNAMYTLWDIFYNFWNCLKWNECHFIPKLINIIVYINKKIFHKRIIPVLPLHYFGSSFHKIFCAETLYYYYLIWEKITVLKTDFSRILLKKKSSDSIINIVDKNKFEL